MFHSGQELYRYDCNKIITPSPQRKSQWGWIIPFSRILGHLRTAMNAYRLYRLVNELMNVSNLTSILHIKHTNKKNRCKSNVNKKDLIILHADLMISISWRLSRIVGHSSRGLLGATLEGCCNYSPVQPP